MNTQAESPVSGATGCAAAPRELPRMDSAGRREHRESTPPVTPIKSSTTLIADFQDM